MHKTTLFCLTFLFSFWRVSPEILPAKILQHRLGEDEDNQFLGESERRVKAGLTLTTINSIG